MTEVVTCYGPRCQKDYQITESSWETTSPWEKLFISRCVWLPSPWLWKWTSFSFGSSPDMEQNHKQEFKSKVTFHTRVKMTTDFRYKRDFNFPSPDNLVKMSKAARIHFSFLEQGHMSLLSKTLWWVHAWFTTPWSKGMHNSLHGDDLLTLLVAPQ